MQLTDRQRAHIEQQIAFFTEELRGEVPLRIHSHAVDEGHGLGGLAFHPSFLAYIDAEPIDPKERKSYDLNSRTKAKRALRHLRRVSKPEYFVAWDVIVKGLSISETVVEMQRWSERAGTQDVWDATKVGFLLLGAVDKLEKSYGKV